MKNIEVVAAILKYKNKYFCAQRKASGPLAKKWEFPGGKIEPGESQKNALKRELLEELNLNVKIGPLFKTINHNYDTFSITMHSYLCELNSISLKLKEHLDYKWLPLKELKNLDWAEADIPIVESLINKQAVEKSLFNKSIDSFIYNPSFIINTETKNIKDKILELLYSSKRIDIAVSYIVWSGLSLIYKQLEKFDKSSRILVTTEGMVSDPQSLKKLLELPIQTKVYSPTSDSKGFHLKTFFGEKKNQSRILVGSSNISARAFGLAHEMIVEINTENNGSLIEEHHNIFNNLWNDPCSKFIKKEFIEEYSKIFYEKKKLDKQISTLYLKNKIIPNYMQRKALSELENYREYSNKGLIIAATGTGKTYLSAFDVKQTKSKKVLFLVHNRLILSSAYETYKKVFPDNKLIELNSSNTNEIKSSQFIFTTDKTAYNHLYKKYPNDYFDYIIYDEAHKIGEKTHYHSLIKYFTPKFTLGITATPERTKDPKFLFKIFEYTIPYEIRLLDAMNHQLVCPFTYYGLNLQNKLLDANEKFNYYELANFMKFQLNEKGHFGKKLKGIVFCSNISEAKKLSTELNNLKIKSIAITSEHSSREETEVHIQNLKNDNNNLNLICVVNQFNEGIDIPEINVIFMLRNTTSSIIYLQQLGRGLRKTQDPHKYVTVFDIIGNSNNNYSIAEVLTGNTTADKRILFKEANKKFQTVSPFINVHIEEKAMENIIKSISNNFKVESKLKEKFRNELFRFKIIPSLVELYKNPNFKELNLLQLLCKNFYEPFIDYYVKKYNISKNDKFLEKFFGLITQFTFRGYNQKILKEYVSLLKGNKTSNETLIKTLIPKKTNGKKTAINSDYFKKGNNFVDIFKYNKTLSLTDEIIYELKKRNAYLLFLEHIELFNELSNRPNYKMKPFELVNKGEFLFNSNANDCYMNSIGERIDHIQKRFYCIINVSAKETFHDNYIDNFKRIVYMTQESSTEEKAKEKINLIKNGYDLLICAKFPHLGYSNTSYFNLGKIHVDEVSSVITHPTKDKNKFKFNHKIFLKLENQIPEELLQYKNI